MDITNDSRAPFSHWSFQGQIWALLQLKQEGWRRLLEKILKSGISVENFTSVTVLVRNGAKFGEIWAKDAADRNYWQKAGKKLCGEKKELSCCLAVDDRTQVWAQGQDLPLLQNLSLRIFRIKSNPPISLRHPCKLVTVLVQKWIPSKMLHFDATA